VGWAAARWTGIDLVAKFGLGVGMTLLFTNLRPRCVDLEHEDPLALVHGILMAPPAETLLFEVLLFGALLRRVRPELAALVVASAFGALHEHLHPLARLVMVPHVLVEVWAWHKTRSVLLVASMHGLMNALAFAWSAGWHHLASLPVCTEP
jgi:membrane protease YdiL (CAAX protease family)